MDIRELQKNFAVITKQRNYLFVGVIICIAIIFLLSLSFSRIETTTILLPSEVNEKMEISKSTVSESYIEQRSRDFVFNLLNLHPDSARYSTKQALKLIHPDYHQALSEDVEKLVSDISEKRYYTSFYLRSMDMNPKTQTVNIVGLHETKAANIIHRKVIKEFQLKYVFVNGGIKFTHFKEYKKHQTDLEEEENE